MISPQVVWLEAAFADELAKLVEIYGDRNVLTSWGLLAYWL